MAQAEDCLKLSFLAGYRLLNITAQMPLRLTRTLNVIPHDIDLSELSNHDMHLPAVTLTHLNTTLILMEPVFQTASGDKRVQMIVK